MKKAPTPITQLYNLQVQLQDSFDHWQDLHQNGGSDPFYSYGVNLNLIRNHIIAYKREATELCEKNLFPLPTIFSVPTPDEVDSNYYANSDQIIQNGLQIPVKTVDEQLSHTSVMPQHNAPSKSINTTPLAPMHQEYLEQIPAQWQVLLDCAAQVYKHKFANQVMIFGQNRAATMVATEDDWRAVGRYLLFNQKPIASVFQGKGALAKNYLYDISQTQGGDVVRTNFTLTKAEQDSLALALSQRFKLGDCTLDVALSKLIRGVLSTQQAVPNGVLESTEYLVKTKLGLPCKLTFSPHANHLELTKIGESMQTNAHKLLDTIGHEIIKIRSVDNEQNNHIGRRAIHSDGREPLSTRERDNLQAGNHGAWNSVFGAVNRDNARSGQLSFGQIWATNNAVHEGKSLVTAMGTDDERGADGAAALTRGRTQSDENLVNGQHGTSAATPEIGRHPSGGTALRAPASASGGNHAKRDLQASLASEPLSLTFSPKVRFADNINAVTLLKEIEQRDLSASKEEQEMLSKYVGLGGLANVFSDTAKGWEGEYVQLKTLLTDDEYSAARASTLTAYYTEPAIIKAMYEGVINLGFNGSINLLEPSMGVGNFFKALPAELENAHLHGVELDSITGRIAKQLYPTASIQIKGYQDTSFRDIPLNNGGFDVVVGNVPFGEFKVSNERHSLLIHDFFFAKALDDLKENGVLAFITSKGTLDKSNPTFRKYLSHRAELIGAIRLPNTAFKGIAGTEVTTDIIFMRKREREREQEVVDEPNWVSTGFTNEKVPINQYFLDNPQNLLGKMVMESSKFGQSSALKPLDEADLVSELSAAINAFTSGHESVMTIAKPPQKVEVLMVIKADPAVKNFTYTVVDDALYYRENDTMSLYNGKHAGCIKSLHDVRKSVRDIIAIQSGAYESGDFEKALHALNQTYDNFVEKHGNINTKLNKQAFCDDGDFPLLLSIENVDGKGEISKAMMFSKATIKPKTNFVPQTYEDLITLSMSQLGRLDLKLMASHFGVDEDEIVANLKGEIFKNPATLAYETADFYLSGNVKEKLDIARKAAALDANMYTQNVEALQNVQPTPLTADEIDFKLGSSFIDLKYYKQFMYELAQTPSWYKETDGASSKNKIILTYNEFTSEYTIYGKTKFSNVQTSSAFGTQRKNSFQIIEDSLNLKGTKVYDVKLVNDKEKQVLNIKETQLARQKQELIRHEFKDWILRDPVRANDVIKAYNDRFNVFRTQEFDGKNLAFEGISNEIELRDHQKDAVARCLYSGKNVLLGHVVGAGKTYTMAAAAMELKRIGVANKPLFVVPNHLTEQWGSDFLKLYPAANILAAKKIRLRAAQPKTVHQPHLHRGI